MLIFSSSRLSILRIQVVFSGGGKTDLNSIPIFAPFVFLFLYYYNYKILLAPHELNFLQRVKVVIRELSIIDLSLTFFINLLFIQLVKIPTKYKNSDVVNVFLKNSELNLWVSRIAQAQGVTGGPYTEELENELRTSFEKKCYAKYWCTSDFWRRTNFANFGNVKIKTSTQFIKLPVLNLVESKSLKFLTLDDATIVNGTYVHDSRYYYQNTPYQNSGFSAFPQREIIAFDKKFYAQESNQLSYLDTGIFIGSSGNWYHFLVEVLPRGILGKEKNSFNDPLVLNSLVPKNIFSICEALTGTPPVLVADGEVLKVNELTVAFDGRHTSQSGMQVSTSNVFLNRVSDIALVRDWMRTNFPPVKFNTPKFVFLARGVHANRKMLNFVEVEVLLCGLGFETIYPNSLNISEQIAIFENCEILVAEGGASLTNLMFLNRNCKFIRIESISEKQHLGFWNQFCEILELSVTTIVGLPKYGYGEIYAGHNVDLNQLRKLLI